MNDRLSPLLEQVPTLELRLVLELVFAGAAGLVLGAIFFGGLWWTLRKSLASPRPALWILGSLLARMSLLLVGLYLVSDGHWQRLLVGLVGVIGARFLVLRLTGPADPASERRDGGQPCA
ncbi:ATP synthase subunit I [Lamprobacter modestohalophilus]|uniref:ATP synthase subunit I n=1 Tax=Lamprobacter modestohalophilus TaxID=1064514 RepID=UPI002ADEB8D9|nr:ATP synthase subunit I [Lamprobacter modestohalophilus]MEA1053083.1 ATP synthase subunit I [Lamprobacter modestohalophilus]